MRSRGWANAPLDQPHAFQYARRATTRTELTHMAKQPKKRTPPKPKPRPAELAPNSPAGRVLKLDSIRFQLICEELARTGSKYKACEALGFDHSTVSQAIRDQEALGDDSWRECWDGHYDMFRDSLEQAAISRARDGVATEFRINPQTGEKVPTRIEYSDTLMVQLLKGHFPERYRERISVSGTVGMQPSTVDFLANLSPRAKLQIREIIIKDLEEQRAIREAAEAPEAEYTPVLEDKSGE